MKEFIIVSNGKYCNTAIFEQENAGKSLCTRGKDWIVEGADNQEEAQRLYDNHNPSAPTEPTIEQKLASVGVNLEDLKSALGL